jgi:hypothetical protein
VIVSRSGVRHPPGRRLHSRLISITDGQVYLSPRLFRRGVLPAVDVGRSVSRVGGKALDDLPIEPKFQKGHDDRDAYRP